MSGDAGLGEELVRLASVDNFRDVTGPDTAYVATDGTPLRRGVAYRSNELLLSDVDTATLTGLGIGQVLDLRRQHEIDAHPDVEVPGATWSHVEVRGIPMEELGELVDRDAAHEVMRQVYRGFVERDGAREAFGEVLRRIADADAPVLFHCTAGKDRTGWAAALLLHHAGVADEVVLEDYLLTNTFSSATRAKYLGLVREHLGEDALEVYERVVVADADYLHAGYAALDAAYGDRAAYLRDGLGLTDDELDRLRTRLRG